MEKCKNCGKEMKKGFRKRVFCCDECREAYYHSRKNVACVECGNELTGKQRLYCCEECRKKATSRNQMERNKILYAKSKPEPEPEVKKRKRGRPKKWSKELAEFNGTARDLGLSYGQLEGQKYLERLRGMAK